MSNVTRLKDPHNCVEDRKRLKKLQEKISVAMTKLFRDPKKGGNPFLFSLIAPKEHELAITLPGLGMPFTTAATDGKKFFWNPDFLESLSLDEVSIVMEHESYHVVFFHTKRGLDKNRRIFNICVDYIVNTIIEIEHDKNKRSSQLWGGNLGTPVSFDALLSHINGDCELPEKAIFSDKKIHGRSPEDLYDDIKKQWNKSPRKCNTCERLTKDKDGNLLPRADTSNPKACPECGIEHDPLSSIDSHIEQALSKNEVLQDIRRAAEQVKRIAGSVPNEIEDIIGSLEKPRVKFTDLVRSSLMRKENQLAQRNNWKRFRKRWIEGDPKQYIPQKHGFKPRWLALLDTSASMSINDIVYAVSQLQILGSTSEGFVVPVDAKVHWNNVTSISNVEDLKSVKIIGRGGTVFDEFFQDFPSRLGTDFDVIIVLTDGYLPHIPKSLRPPCDVVWVLCTDLASFQPSFGRVVPLKYKNP
jgi:predicted metal-dependent peptidase